MPAAGQARGPADDAAFDDEPRLVDGRFNLPDRACLDRGRCGKLKGDHAVHVQYDVGGQILATWPDSSWSNDGATRPSE